MKKIKKLQLNREMLRKLTDDELGKVGGGAGVQTAWCSTAVDGKCPGMSATAPAADLGGTEVPAG